MLKTLHNISLVLVIGSMLAACTSGEFADLDEFMEEKRSRPGGVIPPIPAFKAYKAFSYSPAYRDSRDIAAAVGFHRGAG